MKDSTHIKRAPHDTEQHLLQKEQLSDSENCLKTMKMIASLIEDVSIVTTLLCAKDHVCLRLIRLPRLPIY